MLSVISSRLGFTNPTAPTISLSTEETEQEEYNNTPSQFPLINSIQRAKSTTTSTTSTSSLSTNSISTPIPTPSFSFDSPPVSDDEDEEDDEERAPKIEKSALVAPTSTVKLPKKRVKVFVEPGYSQLHWAKLKSSGADLRGGITVPQRITPSMLAQHKSKDDCWQAYNGKVYNVTPFMKYHPGGIPELMRSAGKDGTELFMKTHAWVNADFMLEGTCIGFLQRED